MFGKTNKANKANNDQNLELERARRILALDQEIFERKVNNWEAVDTARREAYETRLALLNERAQLQLEVTQLRLQKLQLEQDLKKLAKNK